MSSVATILVQPLSRQLTTVTAATAQVDATTQDDTFNLSNLIDRASGIISGYCGQPFGLRTVSEVFHQAWQYNNINHVMPYHQTAVRAMPPLILTHSPVAGIVSVVEDGVTLTTTDWENDSGLMYRMTNGYRIRWIGPTVTIIYQAGYTLPNDNVSVYTLPLEIEDVCLSLVQSGFFNRASNPSVAMELTEGVGRTLYKQAGGVGSMPLDDGLRMVLEPYRARVW